MKDDTVLGFTPWRGDLESAKKHARDYYLINKSRYDATGALVYDENREIVYSCPET